MNMQVTSSTRQCTQCSSSFEFSEADQALLAKMTPEFNGQQFPFPEPLDCSDCRKKARLLHRNERNLYHRKCDLTGHQVLSAVSADKPSIVYEQSEWWGDGWEALDYGQDFDFNKPFFEQFGELLLNVPRLNISVSNTENSDFCHLIADCKNCYLVFESSHVEDSYYGYWLQKSRNCIDCSYSHECEQCYEVDNCYNCYSLFYSQNSQNCSDSAFLDNCIACKDCLFSTNLRQKQYCIMNEQYTKEEYEAKKAELLFGSYNATANMKQLFADFMLKQPHRAQRSTNAENSTGDYIINSKDCHECFHAHEAEGCRYGEHTWRHSKDNMDVDTVGREAELVYQALNTGIGGYQCAFTNQCWTNVANIYYSQHCFSSKDLFGCVGLTNKQYCIFNKQYSKEQYEQLVADIIKHMQQTRLPDGQAGEWGQYFPASLSTFGYNESSAFEEFPLTKDEAIAKGYNWHDDTESSDYMGPKVELPDNIEDADESICQQILTCAVTGKPYKIIPHEFAFYKQMGLSLPRLHPNERHTQRMARRTPCKLWNRECHKCSTAISTSYSPDRPEIIYCEDCYLSTVY